MTAMPWDYRPRNSSVMKRFMKRAALFRYATVNTFVEIKRKVHLLICLAYPSINIFPVGEG